VAGNGVTVGQEFTFTVDGNPITVPAGPASGGYCRLAGYYPLQAKITIQENIPGGYFVSRIEVKPNRVVNKWVAQGKVVIKVGTGVTEVIFTNKALTVSPTATKTAAVTATLKPTKTPTATPQCGTACTPTPTPVPRGRLQICKESDGTGVTGNFSFKFGTKTVTIPVDSCSSLLYVDAGPLTITEVARTGYAVSDIRTLPTDRLLSEDLPNRTAVVTIVQGNASTQTIVVFSNRSTQITSAPASANEPQVRLWVLWDEFWTNLSGGAQTAASLH